MTAVDGRAGPDMNDVIGTHNVLMITLDTLRYDVAHAAYNAGETPTLAGLFPNGWECRHTPASFTLPAHQAFFAGFLPTPVDDPGQARLFAVSFPGSETTSARTKTFGTADIVAGLAGEGYATYCIGGVGFFNDETALGSVLPAYFDNHEWRPEFGVTDPQSAANQVAAAARCFRGTSDRPAFVFVNVSAIHQPNWFYRGDRDGHSDGDRLDTIESHRGALRYVDGQLAPLLAAACADRACFVLITSDHGTAYGEDGYAGHRLAHDVVWTVPFATAVLEAGSWV